jgi:ribonuclease HI
MNELVTIHCDGLCEPRNPGGYACYGWLARDEGGNSLAQDYGCIGHGANMTNNVAEYTAIIEALSWAYKQGHKTLLIRTDSQLTVKQITGVWSCRSPLLLPLLERVRKAKAYFNATFEWVPREQNEEADALTRQAYAEARKKR